MTDDQNLHLYEEIMLLAIGNKTGNVLTQHCDVLTATAVMAELAIDHRITVDEASHRQTVQLVDGSPHGDPIIDDLLRKLRVAKLPASLKDWIRRASSVPNFRHKVAMQLCARGIVRAAEENVMSLFARRYYAEIDPQPERTIRERLRDAIFSDGSVDSRTIVLVGLARISNLLNRSLSFVELKRQEKRIEALVRGELMSRTAGELIAANTAVPAQPFIF